MITRGTTVTKSDLDALATLANSKLPYRYTTPIYREGDKPFEFDATGWKTELSRIRENLSIRTALNSSQSPFAVSGPWPIASQRISTKSVGTIYGFVLGRDANVTDSVRIYSSTNTHSVYAASELDRIYACTTKAEEISNGIQRFKIVVKTNQEAQITGKMYFSVGGYLFNNYTIQLIENGNGIVTLQSEQTIYTLNFSGTVSEDTEITFAVKYTVSGISLSDIFAGSDYNYIYAASTPVLAKILPSVVGSLGVSNSTVYEHKFALNSSCSVQNTNAHDASSDTIITDPEHPYWFNPLNYVYVSTYNNYPAIAMIGKCIPISGIETNPVSTNRPYTVSDDRLPPSGHWIINPYSRARCPKTADGDYGGNKDGQPSAGNMNVPSYPVRRDTKGQWSPFAGEYKVAEGDFEYLRGGMIYSVTVRRPVQLAGSVYKLKSTAEAYTVKIGQFVAGQFIEIQEITIPAGKDQVTTYTEIPVMEDAPIYYQAADDIQVNAVFVARITPSANGLQSITGPINACHYNDTLNILQML